MSPIFEVKERYRDDSLGIISKEIKLSSSVSITTPSKSQKEYGGLKLGNPDVVEINNLFRDQQLQTLIDGGGRKRLSNIDNMKYDDTLNLIIFDLQTNQVPSREKLRIFTQHLNQASDKSIFLPTVKTSLLKDKITVIGPRSGKSQEKYVWSDVKVDAYLNMMDFIIDQIALFGNRKEIIGTIPLIIPKYSRQIVDLYHKKGVKSFAIDGNFKNILGSTNLGHLGYILSAINEQSPLNESLIYTCNLGIPRFSQNTSRADDFLSLFTYIDVLGTNFKPRFSPRSPTVPTVKMFSREHYCYNLYGTFPQASRILGRAIDRNYVKNFNQTEQLTETNVLKRRVGRERMSLYIQTKRTIDSLIHDRLRDLANRLRI